LLDASSIMQPNAGILALGLYVPPEVRRNDWWPADVVARWVEQRRGAPTPALPASLSEGAKRVLRAQAEQADDPFQGTIERRVLSREMTVHDMEDRAARDAIARAGIDPAEIDLLLTHTVVPDYQLANPACSLHERLGLPAACLSMHTEATAYSVFGQLALAEASIAAGRARYALLVQSCAATRLFEMDDPSSVLAGDGATAIVLGPVPAGRGVLSLAHYTEGRYARSLIMSVPGGRWFDEGRVRVHIGDLQQLLDAHLRIADACKESIDAALARSGARLSEIDFLCVYEGTSWLQRAVRDHIGARHAKLVEIFPRFGYLSSATVPAALYVAEQEGLLVPDDLVVLTGGGTGQTYGAAVLRWGGRASPPSDRGTAGSPAAGR
jgi:3-oxoacyl-[acyl-carrier-protein] synthase III